MSEPKRILFVCIGNACRSQMAEAFARAYGSDVLVASSAGLFPAKAVPPDTLRAMKEKSLDLSRQVPKSGADLDASKFDFILNMSGFPLPPLDGAVVREWEVPDPIVMDYKGHCAVRNRIEKLVRNLILELRREQRDGPPVQP